jgi:hypothetical protein
VKSLDELIKAMINKTERMEITEDEWLNLANELWKRTRKKGNPGGFTSDRASFEREVFRQVEQLSSEKQICEDKAMRELSWPNPDVSFELGYEAIKKIVNKVKRRDKAWENNEESYRLESRKNLGATLEEIFEEQQLRLRSICPYCGSILKEGMGNS